MGRMRIWWAGCRSGGQGEDLVGRVRILLSNMSIWWAG